MPPCPGAEDIPKGEGRRPASTGRNVMRAASRNRRSALSRGMVLIASVAVLGAFGATPSSAMPADDFPGSGSSTGSLVQAPGAPCFRQPLRWPTAEIGPVPRCGLTLVR